MKIYFDVCCINRPFDNQSQDRIHLEAEAILSILKNVDEGLWFSISSDVVTIEIKKTFDPERRERLTSINNKAKSYICVDDKILKRTKIIQSMGFTTYDAMHIACSEEAKADVFFTTDDKLLKSATKNKENLSVLVQNPLIWLQKELMK